MLRRIGDAGDAGKVKADFGGEALQIGFQVGNGWHWWDSSRLYELRETRGSAG